MSSDGAIMRYGSDGTTAENADYTTVTCMVFPIVDMAVLLKEMEDERYGFFEEALHLRCCMWHASYVGKGRRRGSGIWNSQDRY